MWLFQIGKLDHEAAYSFPVLNANLFFLFSSISSFLCASRLRAAADWAFDVVIVGVAFVLFCNGLFFNFAPCGGGNVLFDSDFCAKEMNKQYFSIGLLSEQWKSDYLPANYYSLGVLFP